MTKEQIEETACAHGLHNIHKKFSLLDVVRDVTFATSTKLLQRIDVSDTVRHDLDHKLQWMAQESEMREREYARRLHEKEEEVERLEAQIRAVSEQSDQQRRELDAAEERLRCEVVRQRKQRERDSEMNDSDCRRRDKTANRLVHNAQHYFRLPDHQRDIIVSVFVIKKYMNLQFL